MADVMVLKPRISEKAYNLSQSKNVYIFEVPQEVGKLEIADAVTKQFGVTVESVNVTNLKGKVKRTYRRGGRQTFGKRSDTKKAYVTVKQGDNIPIFAAEEEAEKKAAKAAKKEKK